MRRDRNRSDQVKLLKLCRQAERRLSLVLSGEVRDQDLEGVLVCSVTAPHGASTLTVEVAPPPNRPDLDEATLLRKLYAAEGWLRSEVAAAIHRNRTPRLGFVVATEPGEEEGEYLESG